MYMNHINSCLNPDIVMRDHDEIDTTQVNIEKLTHDMSRLHLVESPKIKYTLPWDSNTYANSNAPPPKVNGEYVYCPFWVKHGAPKDYMLRNTYTDIPAWKICGYKGGVDFMLDYMWSSMHFESKKHLFTIYKFLGKSRCPSSVGRFMIIVWLDRWFKKYFTIPRKCYIDHPELQEANDKMIQHGLYKQTNPWCLPEIPDTPLHILKNNLQ